MNDQESLVQIDNEDIEQQQDDIDTSDDIEKYLEKNYQTTLAEGDDQFNAREEQQDQNETFRTLNNDSLNELNPDQELNEVDNFEENHRIDDFQQRTRKRNHKISISELSNLTNMKTANKFWGRRGICAKKLRAIALSINTIMIYIFLAIHFLFVDLILLVEGLIFIIINLLHTFQYINLKDSVWLFIGLSIVMITLKLALQYYFPSRINQRDEVDQGEDNSEMDGRSTFSQRLRNNRIFQTNYLNQRIFNDQISFRRRSSRNNNNRNQSRSFYFRNQNNIQPQSQNQRRIGRVYQRDFYQRRRQNNNEISNERRQHMIELSELGRRNINRHEYNNEQSPLETLSTILEEEDDMNLRDQRQQANGLQNSNQEQVRNGEQLEGASRNIFSSNINRQPELQEQLRNQLSEREFLRNELTRLLTERGFENEADTIDSRLRILLRRNLQFINLNRFNPHGRAQSFERIHQSRQSERSQILLSQLPTYEFVAKQQFSSINDRKQSQDNDENQRQENLSLQQEEKRDNGGEQEEDVKNFCTVCLENFQNKEIIKILPCFHQFHSVCIDDWLLRKTCCPVCKFDLAETERIYQQYEQQQE